MSTIRIVEDGFVYRAADQPLPEYRYLPGICRDPDNPIQIPVFERFKRRDLSVQQTILATFAVLGTAITIVFIVIIFFAILRA